MRLVGPCMAICVIFFDSSTGAKHASAGGFPLSTGAGGHSVNYYLRISPYGLLTCVLVLGLRMFALGGLHAARGIHERMLVALPVLPWRSSRRRLAQTNEPIHR